MDTFTILMLIVAIVLNALANILIKASAIYSNDETIIGLITNPWLISGLISFGLAFVFYRYVLSKGLPLSIAYPLMTTTGFAIVIIASRIFFNERLVLIQWLGIGFIVLGIWLIASKI
ncbi:MAG: cation transporter [Leptospiraceae bacterium]|nr:MAG: cation transporter [Leptospiraceae bacterium]